MAWLLAKKAKMVKMIFGPVVAFGSNRKKMIFFSDSVCERDGSCACIRVSGLKVRLAYAHSN